MPASRPFDRCARRGARSPAPRLAAVLAAAILPLLVTASASPLRAQTKGGGGGADASGSGLQACSLLTATEVREVTGRREWGPPESTPLYGGAGSSCTFTNAQVIVFSGKGSEARWNALLKNYGHDGAPRHAAAGLGDRAYFFYPEPGSKYEDTSAFVVVFSGQHVLAVSVAAEEGKPAESARPHALALARIVLARLP